MTTLDFISCANCGEPLDGEQPSCPMCGAVISPETIAELVLPKPEEVVIEVQTAEHLRFRLPSRPPKERWTIAFILFSCGGFLIYKFGKILFHIGIVLDSRIINLDIILPMFFS